MHTITTVAPDVLWALRYELGVPDPHDYSSLTARAEQLRLEVETKWHELPDEKKRVLAGLAYRIFLEELPLWHRRVVRPALECAWFLQGLIRPKWKADRDAFALAIVKLVSAILDAIERDDPKHQAKIASAVSEAVRGVRVSPPLSLEEFRERLARKLPDQASR